MAVAQYRVSLPLVGPTVEDLLLWRDIKKSGLVFGSITAIFLFVGMSSLSPLALALRALAYGSLVAIAWSLVGGFFGRSGPPVPPILNSGFTEESFTNLASSLRPRVNTALSFLGTVVSGKNPKLGLQVFGAAFLASYLVNLPILALSYTVALLSFTLPKLYELRKDDADKIFAQVKAKFDELYAKFDEAVLKKLPKGGAPVPKKEQ